MRLNLTLQRRLARLEKRQRHRIPLPTIITGIYGEELSGAITGIEGDDGQQVHLKPGETLCELQARAGATLPGRMLRTLYAADSPRNDETAPMAPNPPKQPIGNPWPSADGGPGIGRVASRAELERMGAVPIPAERIL